MHVCGWMFVCLCVLPCKSHIFKCTSDLRILSCLSYCTLFLNSCLKSTFFFCFCSLLLSQSHSFSLSPKSLKKQKKDWMNIKRKTVLLNWYLLSYSLSAWNQSEKSMMNQWLKVMDSNQEEKKIQHLAYSSKRNLHHIPVCFSFLRHLHDSMIWKIIGPDRWSRPAIHFWD